MQEEGSRYKVEREIGRGAVAAVLIVAAIILSLILISGASSEVDVPDLINLSRGKARVAQGGIGIVFGEVAEGFSYDIWKGSVMKKRPAPGKIKALGTKVVIVINTGR